MSNPIVIDVPTKSLSYQAVVGNGILGTLGERISKLMTPDRIMVVTDSNVGPLYLDTVLDALSTAGLSASSTTIPAGEPHKNLDTYGTILSAMAQAQLTRSSLVVALGGGVVGDMAGFAAATYMRGIPVVQVPTTLLSMVDSSVGGKTAIDLDCGKNLVGAFLQPSLVVADVACLKTLDPYVFCDGLGEVVKHAVLASPDLCNDLQARPVTQDEDPSYLAEVVARNITIKRDVVVCDEQEHGLRQTLNLGHTIGHAIEAASGYRQGHGHCVAAGLCCIARAAEQLGWCEGGFATRIEACTAAQGLPIATNLDADEVFEQATHDKKRHASTVNVVIPQHLGEAVIRTVSLEELHMLVRLGCSGSPREA